MIDKKIDIHTHDGVMDTFITHPEEGGPHPVVILLMDLFGLRDELYDMAHRIGSAGYYVVIPNLYYRRMRDFDFKVSDQKDMFGHMESLENASVCKDIDSIMEFSQSDAVAQNGPIGCVGYCMSGAFAFSAAATFPEQIAATASFHGTKLCTETEDSPHINADKIKGEIYFGCAQNDEFVPQAMIDKLDDHLANSKINYQIEIYPEAGHGFVFSTRPNTFHQLSFDLHWERLLALLARNL